MAIIDKAVCSPGSTKEVMGGGKGRQIVPRGCTELPRRQGAALQGKMLSQERLRMAQTAEALFLMEIIAWFGWEGI